MEPIMPKNTPEQKRNKFIHNLAEWVVNVIIREEKPDLRFIQKEIKKWNNNSKHSCTTILTTVFDDEEHNYITEDQLRRIIDTNDYHLLDLFFKTFGGAEKYKNASVFPFGRDEAPISLLDYAILIRDTPVRDDNTYVGGEPITDYPVLYKRIDKSLSYLIKNGFELTVSENASEAREANGRSPLLSNSVLCRKGSGIDNATTQKDETSTMQRKLD